MDERRIRSYRKLVIREEYHDVIAKIKEEFPWWVVPGVESGEIVYKHEHKLVTLEERLDIMYYEGA